MPQRYSIFTALLACAGCVSLFVTGEVNPVLALTGMGLFPGYYRFMKGEPPAPKWAVGVLSILTVLVFIFDSLAISRDYLISVAHLTITFQAIKSFDLKEPWDHLQVYFMSLLQLIIVSELIISIMFGFIFIMFLVIFITAMVVAHFMKEGTSLQVRIRTPVIYITLLAMILTGIFFVVSPRLAGGLWGKSRLKSIRTTGFSERVDFGSFGEVKLDQTVVMRIELSDNARRPYYWRGITLDYFDGISWKNTMSDKVWIYKKEGKFVIGPFTEEEAVIQRIYQEPMDTDVLFGIGNIAAIESPGRYLFVDQTGSLFLYAKKGKRFSYTVYSTHRAPSAKDLPDGYLQLPPGMEKIGMIAQEISDGQDTDMKKALMIERYLRRNYTYSLSPPAPAEEINPVEDFLLTTKEGYCEHYATAMVFMLRSVNIPARIVTGYAGGELNEYGGYIIIRQSDAHSWVEAPIDGIWRRFDPTPEVLLEKQSQSSLYVDMLRLMWDRYVIAFSSADQRGILRAFSRIMDMPRVPELEMRSFAGYAPVLILIACAAILIYLYLHARLKKYDLVTGHYIRVRNVLKRRGAVVNASSTPSDILREAERLGVNGTVAEFILLYQECRFGERQLTFDEKLRYRRLVHEIKKNAP
jgi:transglutaminase-like putative cysteine protease